MKRFRGEIYMPAINFKRVWADAVRSGDKPCTIRQVWKRPIREGDILYLYTGMRTKQCKKLREAECIAVTPLRVETEKVTFRRDDGVLVVFERDNGTLRYWWQIRMA